MKAGLRTADALSTAASVAPEDLKRGDYIAVLTEIVELPTFLWHDAPASERDELVRLRCIPSESGLPLKVKAICLPFVLVKSPLGERATIDIRKVQLVRLDRRYAKTVRRKLRKQQLKSISI